MDILLVEDEPKLGAQVLRALTRVGHEVERALDGPSAVERALAKRTDLILLDVNLPGYDGFEVLRRIREGGVAARVLMLTARSEVGDRVAGLKAGADDYLTKPFAMDELLARVEALGRRGGATEPSDMLVAGNLRLDTVRRRVTCRGERVELSPREFEVLLILLREVGRTFSRDEICERIWEREHEYDTRTVEIFIMRLRKKLAAAGAESVIETVRGVGYVMRTS